MIIAKNSIRTMAVGFVVVAISTMLSAREREYVLEKGGVRAVFNERGRLVNLLNTRTGHEWTGGGSLWRLYFDRRITPPGTPVAKVREEREIPVLPEEQSAAVTFRDGCLSIVYGSLKCRNERLSMRLELTVRQEDDGRLRFAATIQNSQPRTIIRELHYPLVQNCILPSAAELFITEHGGMRFKDPVGKIARPGLSPLYMGPDQEFRQFEHWGYGTLKYPSYAAANCFAFLTEQEGLYVASHDPSFQDTMHILRCWPDATGKFNRLEAGLSKFPNLTCGGKWENDTNVVMPYSGDWRITAKTYRAWANTWWKKRKVPEWCRKMTGWHRVIFRHQYGKDFFTPADLNGKITRAGDSAGLDTTLCFGWWRRGMDNGYPDSYFETEPDWGGDEGFKKAIADYRKTGHNFLLYFNGKLIDMESDYYLKGPGKRICYRTAAGEAMVEQYRFASSGTFTKLYNARSFATADLREPEWMKFLEKAVDRAIEFGASGVFFDQLGSCEPAANFDASGEFSVPNVRTIAAKAEALAHLRDYIEAKGLHDFAIGTEAFVDCSAQSADYIHNVGGATSPESFIDWTRYAFPECIVSDREIRDDSDIGWRVNHNLLVGLVSDVEIWRCRALIDETPNYRKKLAEVNALKRAHPMLLTGTYTGPDNITVESKDGLLAAGFTQGDKMAVVVCTSRDRAASGSVKVAGMKCVGGSCEVKLPPNGITVLEFAKEKPEKPHEVFVPAERNAKRSETPLAGVPQGAKEFQLDEPRNENGPVLNCADYGVSELNDDNTLQLRAAFADAKAKGASRLELSCGRYAVNADSPLALEGFSDFTFDGGGAVFVSHRHKGAFLRLSRCVRTKFMNFSLDWDWSREPLASIVRVKRTDRNSYDLEFVDYSRFPDRKAAFVILSAYDPKTRSVGIEDGITRFVDFGKNPEDRTSKTWLDGRTVRVAKAPDGIEAGQLYRLQHFYYDYNGFNLHDVEHLRFENVTVLSTPGHAFVMHGKSHHVSFDHVRIVPPKGDPKRVITCTADHFHIGQSRGFIKIENCEFSLGADDIVNMHDLTAFARKTGSRTLKTLRAHASTVTTASKGDRIELRNSDYSPTGFFGTLAMATRISGKEGGFELTFSEDIPEETKEGFVLFNWAYDTRNVIVRNCFFHDNRARGLLILARDVTIENNVFRHQESGAIKIETGYTLNRWSEGYGVSNVVIRGNLFDTVNPSGSHRAQRQRSIYAGVYLKTDPSQETTDYPAIKDILIEGNVFRDNTGVAAYLSSVSNVVVRKNILEDPTPRREENPCRSQFFLTRAKDVKIVDNTYRASAYVRSPGVAYDAGNCRAIVIKGNRVE